MTATRFTNVELLTRATIAPADLFTLQAPRGWIGRARMLWRLRREFDADLTPFRGQANDVVYRAIIRELLPSVQDRMIREISRRIERDIMGLGFAASEPMADFGGAVLELADELGRWSSGRGISRSRS